MAIVTRETIMNTLLALFQNNAGVAATFPTISRRFMTIDRLMQRAGTPDRVEQPALYLYEGVGLGGGINVIEQPHYGTPGKYVLRVTLVIYAELPGGGTPAGPDETTPGGTVFNPLLETVIAALAPDDLPRGILTLGGIVARCWLSGDALMMTGEIDPAQGQGMATLPLEILMNPSL